MATAVHVSLEEYLQTSYLDGDREYVDGADCREASDRLPARQDPGSSGNDHVFHGAAERHPIFPCTETRMRLGPRRVRIPDVAVFVGAEPTERVPILAAGGRR